jgi:uncharacterized SAM-binding protein YcdF (DUF218 family)
MAAVTGATAKLGQPLQPVNDEKTAALILQIASGGSAPGGQALGFLYVLKIAGLTLLYTLIGFISIIVVFGISGNLDKGSGSSTALGATVFFLPFFSFILAAWSVGRRTIAALVIASLLCLPMTHADAKGRTGSHRVGGCDTAAVVIMWVAGSVKASSEAPRHRAPQLIPNEEND